MVSFSLLKFCRTCWIPRNTNYAGCVRYAYSQELLGVVNALFALLAILGIVADPTTEGIGDSAQALTYGSPKPTEGAAAGKKEA